VDDIDIDELAARLGEVLVLDVRRPEEYEGVVGAPCDPRRGHIPGAVNLDVQELMVLSDDELWERLGPPGDVEIVAYCHSGSRSATAVQILRMVGYHARNYCGSWHEWSRTDHPLETVAPQEGTG
jgi:thiosulfate/3-mercaptopyruvate sulfurtransferase